MNAYGQVIGMTTAASSSGYRPMSTSSDVSATTAYAIPIESASKIAAQIAAGSETGIIHIGEHGLLGIEVQTSNGLGGDISVIVGDVQSGSAAAAAGIGSGDSLTLINGRSISSISDLDDTMAATHVGDKISVGWTDSSGQSQQATVTLTSGAA